MGRTIPGYDYGKPGVGTSPVSMTGLEHLKQSIGWTDADARAIREAAPYLSPRAEAMVDHWRAMIAAQPHLVAAFLKPDGKPDETYKAAVKRRFVQWVRDTCERDYGQDWLNYQHEIGLRHTPAKKNATDGGRTPPVVPLRYLLGFAGVVGESVRPFLADAGVGGERLDAMHAAWRKSVVLQITLWSRAYVREDLW